MSEGSFGVPSEGVIEVWRRVLSETVPHKDWLYKCYRCDGKS